MRRALVTIVPLLVGCASGGPGGPGGDGLDCHSEVHAADAGGHAVVLDGDVDDATCAAHCGSAQPCSVVYVDAGRALGCTYDGGCFTPL